MKTCEAKRAIYLDFEGNVGRRASFAGVLNDDGFEQMLLEEALHPIASVYTPQPHEPPARYIPVLAHSGIGSLRAVSGRDFVLDLLLRCEGKGRHLVAWSSHELQELTAIAPDLEGRLQAVVVDLKPHAKRWKRHFHQGIRFARTQRAGAHQLKRYLRLLGYQLPSYLGEQQAAARISYVRRQLAVRGSYSELTPVAKAKWTKVLDYNWHDCFGLRELAMVVARDSEENRGAE